jgi:hypothetical protein
MVGGVDESDRSVSGYVWDVPATDKAAMPTTVAIADGSLAATRAGFRGQSGSFAMHASAGAYDHSQWDA